MPPAPPRRILLVNWMDPTHPRAGGAERHLLEIFGRLAGRHRITLVTSGYPGARPVASVAGMAVVRVGGTFDFAVRAPFAIRRLLARHRFELLIEDLNKIPLLLPRSIPRLMLAHHLWGSVAFAAAPWPIALLTWLAERPLPLIYAGAEIAAVSPSTRHELIARGVPSDRVVVVENAVDPPPAETVQRAEEPLFVYVGRLQPYKRVDLLIEAARVLQREGQRFRVVIVGNGPDRRRLERLVMRSEQLPVAFLGSVSDAERDTLLARAWANVLMSRKEGYGLTVLEAARMGTPSVVAFAPGLQDAVRHLEDGLWVPYHHLPALADALRYLIDNPDAVTRLGACARARVSGRTWDHAAAEMDRVIHRSLALPHRTVPDPRD